MFRLVKRAGRRLLLAAALLALFFCLVPRRADAPEAAQTPRGSQASQASRASQASQTPQVAASPSGVPAGADLSERTQAGCLLHRTLYYAPCGHSVQRRESLPARLVGLSRQALESEIGDALPGATVTGFSAAEVDASFRLDIPCPLHWVLAAGENGMLAVMQNRDGEALSVVRETDVPLDRLSQEERAQLPQTFDDVQALEGVLESIAS